MSKRTWTTLLLAIVVTFPCCLGFSPFINNKQASNQQRSLFDPSAWQHVAKSTAMAFLLAAGTMTNPNPVLPGGMAHASDSRLVGEIQGSGLVFKDTLNVESFDDPKVRGVSLYISNFQRPITERLSKGDFFSDPSFASVGCAKTSKKIQIADNIATGPQGEEVFEESRSLLFKTLRVQRIYDQEKNTMVYVSFNTRLDKGSDDNKSRFKSSICAVNLD